MPSTPERPRAVAGFGQRHPLASSARAPTPGRSSPAVQTWVERFLQWSTFGPFLFQLGGIRPLLFQVIAIGTFNPHKPLPSQTDSLQVLSLKWYRNLGNRLMDDYRAHLPVFVRRLFVQGANFNLH